MFYTLLVVLISVLAILLISIVLLQSGKGGGLAAEFGGASSSTESIIGGRQAANVLTHATWIGGGVFLVLSLLLAILSARVGGPPESILRSEFQTGPAGQVAPASVLETEGERPPSLLDDAREPGEVPETGRVPAGEPAPPPDGGGSN
jgi:preprotein translocase subunit SecG